VSQTLSIAGRPRGGRRRRLYSVKTTRSQRQNNTKENTMLNLCGKAFVTGAPGGLLRCCKRADGSKNSGRGNCMCPSRLLIVSTTVALPATKTASSGSGGPPRSNQPRTCATRASLATSISWCQRANTRSCLDSLLIPLILRRPRHPELPHVLHVCPTSHIWIHVTTHFCIHLNYTRANTRNHSQFFPSA
jgi:hypothetical protein